MAVESATFVQALSYFCQLEMDKQQSAHRSSEVSTDADRSAVVELPQMPELVAFHLFICYLYFAVAFEMNNMI